MAGSVCLPNSRISTPSSESFPFQVKSPVHLDMTSKMLVKQRPKTDVYIEPPPAPLNRPKTAKVNVMAKAKTPNFKTPKISNGSNVTNGVRRGNMIDYLSHTCNDVDLGDPAFVGTNDENSVLRDDEEYYMNMDPVEYFYSPIIDIFPISSCTARMTSTYQTAVEQSLQSDSHFLPLIENGHLSPRVFENVSKEDTDGNSLSPKSSVCSRKSSFKTSSPLRIVPSKMFSITHHTTSDKKINNDKLLLPQIFDQKNTRDEPAKKITQINDNIGKPNVSCVPTSKNPDSLKPKSKIPVARNVFFKETFNARVDSKLSQKQNQHVEGRINDSRLLKRDPEALSTIRQNNDMQHQNYTTVKTEKRSFIPSHPKVIDVSEMHENGGKYLKLTKNREKTMTIKHKKTFVPPNIGQIIHDQHMQEQSNVKNEKDIQKDIHHPKSREENHRVFFSKRISLGTIPVYNKHGNGEKGLLNPIAPLTTPSLLSDSTAALTSSKRPFTFDRVPVHKDDKQSTQPFSNGTSVRTDGKGKMRPQSDKLYLGGIPTAPMHHQRQPRPALKIRFHKMNF
ncbi:hypothetical protein FSP39_015371 [Pinctada imbricata]|uniref:Uncharacterized protein n=1 Tax=Pinctada imbricata TaxID=66713 RepID=A0AA89CA31_PINIB|nr:hypothetical protein FSP39_015371 [Pinctada imbricata]